MAELAQQAAAESLIRAPWFRRLPIVLQSEASECGLACLAMVAGFHGLETDLMNLRQRFNLSSQGTTLKQIIDMAAELGLSARPLKLEMEQMEQLQVPCIVHWEMQHFVVLKKVRRTGVVIHDPACGERVISWHEVNTLFTGIALELIPTPAFTPRKEKRRIGFRQFWSRASGIKRQLGLLLLLSLMLQMFAIASPYYMQTVIDDVILRSDLNLLTVLALGFGLLLLIEAGTSMLRDLVALQFTSRLNLHMSANVFHHLIRLPVEYFSRRHMGDVVSRFSSLSHIREMLTNGLVAVVIDGLMAIMTLVVMFAYNLRLACVVLAVVFLYGLLRFILYRPFRLLNEELIVSSAKENSHFMESVRAIQTIKLFSKETDRQGQWQNRLADALNKEIKLKHWSIGFNTANHILFGLENIIIVYLAAQAVSGNLMSIGMLYAFMSYKTRFIGAMDSLISKWVEFRLLSVHFERLADIVFSPTDKQTWSLTAGSAKSRHTTTDAANQTLEAQDLQFSYTSTEQPVFAHVNLRIGAGETIAIVGPSGSGKTTLLKCLMGLFTPQDGRVLLQGSPIQHIPDYRQRIAAVMQDDQLLSGSIAENIACFTPGFSVPEVVKYANLANIHDEIMQMPMQYNTLVGEMGSGLSGGQKQRIILARALYKQPQILFLDEATSHLDQSNEAIINAHIRQMAITRIMVAHRQETIQTADRILRLADGKLSDVTRDVKSSPH